MRLLRRNEIAEFRWVQNKTLKNKVKYLDASSIAWLWPSPLTCFNPRASAPKTYKSVLLGKRALIQPIRHNLVLIGSEMDFQGGGEAVLGPYGGGYVRPRGGLRHIESG